MSTAQPLTFDDPIPEGVYPWPEDVERADREEKLSALRSRRDRLEIRWHAAHDVLTHIEDQLTAVEAGIAALEDME